MDDSELIRNGDRNLVAYLRHLADSADGGHFLDMDGLLLFAGGHNYPGTYTNGVIRTSDAEGLDPSDILDRAEQFFRPLRRGFAVWVRDHADRSLEDVLRRRGLWQRPPMAGNPGLASSAPLTTIEAPGGVQLRVAETDEERRHYMQTVLTAYKVGGMPLEMAERVIFSLRSLQDDRVRVVVAYRDGKAVGGATCFVEAGVTGVQWVAVTPEARGLGVGRAAFVHATRCGAALGGRGNVAQGSAMGTPVWEALGMRIVTRYRRYLAKPPA